MEGENYQENLTSQGTDLILDNNKDKSIHIFVQNNTKKFPSSKYVALVHKKQVQKPLLSTFDTIVCLLLLAPCVVGFWRGTWILMELYNKYFSPWLCLFFGIFVHIVFVVVQNNLNSFIKQNTTNTKTKVFVTRLYTYVFAVSTVMHWRGGWEYIDIYLKLEKDDKGIVRKIGSDTTLIVFCGTFICLILLRSLRNCIAPPYIFCTDDANKTFIIPTRFRTEINERKSLYLLDCLFSVLVIGTLVVFVWRGAWTLIDIYLFPEYEIWSAWGSLILGYSAVGIAFLLQPVMRWLCARITGVSRVLAADLFLILSLIGTVNVWRGIWNLLNLYLLPDNLELSCWITHWVCLTILILLGCSNSLLVRGVYIDAEEPAGKCVVFPCYYLRLIFQEQKLKKIQNEQNRTEMANAKPCENNHIVSVQNTNEQFPQTLSTNHKECDVL